MMLSKASTAVARRAVCRRQAVTIRRGVVTLSAAPHEHTEGGPFRAAAWLAVACLVGTTTTTQCETPSPAAVPTSSSSSSSSTDMATTTTTPTAVEYTEAPNPVWPAGICDADVESLVEDCLRDPKINIAAIPDYLERQIYRSTIKLTLNAVYRSVGAVHGSDMLGHELRVLRQQDDAKQQGVRREFQLAQMRGSVAEHVLDKVVDGLLQNKAVNQPLIPDMVERQLYKNCLTIIFRILDMMAATFTITCCGHDLGITVQPSQTAVVTHAAVQRATQIDPDLMLQYARTLRLQPEKEVNQHRSWWNKWIRGTQEEMLAQLHATLYSLVLGIMDDVLEHTKIRLLSDTLQFDLVPVPLQVQRAKAAAAAVPAKQEEDEKEESLPESSAALPFATFTAGLGIGLTLMSILGKR